MPKLEPPPKPEPTEQMIQNDIMRTVGALPDVRLWRNNTLALPSVNIPAVLAFLRVGAVSSAVRELKASRRINCGLAVGSADLIGIVNNGRFLSIEVKTARGRTSKEQKKWAEIVRKFGGAAGIARSVEDAMVLVEEARGHDGSS